ncbi:hypothetical protein [Haloferula sp. A504]|uniref:hypothetical protein n=1 Tax=Haloferula sp. A504 TaxID=3373601 RepID=UPI0031C5851C|nr:hypothetical protein [Verrucomicrobiaceae bacterium E54]
MTPAKRRIKRVEVVVFCLVLAIVVMVSVPLITGQQKSANYTEALSNTRSLSCAFLEFDQEFGSFPTKETRSLVMDATGTDPGPPTGSANDCFRQLIAYGIQSEDIFFATHPEGSSKPDNLTQPFATEALKPGEAGLSYVYGLNTSLDPEYPLLIAPMRTGSHLAHRTYGGKVVVRFIDSSTLPCTVNRHGEILLPDGTLLFDPARPIWQNRPIDIRHPEFPN